MSNFKQAREAFEQSWLRDLKKILPGNDNYNFYKKLFSEMSDEKFKVLLDQARDVGYLPLFQHNLKPSRPKIDALIDLCQSWGEKVYHNLELTDFNSPDLTFTTPQKYLVMWGTVRRQIQTLENKISIPENNDSIDQLSGQVVGSSKGSSMSNTEIGILNSKDLVSTIFEYVNPRGGNNEAYDLMEQSIIEKGFVDLNDVRTESRPTSIETLDAMLMSVQIKSNI